MIAFAYYLLKMFVCSGLLFAYYHLALKNKLFHYWNRFYLIASVIISLAVPCLEFNIWNQADSGTDIRLLHAVYSADAYVAEVTSGRNNLSVDQWITIGYGFVSAFVFVTFILALIKIYSIIRSHTVMEIDDIKFVNTEERNAPFSFLNYVFWNKQIDLKSSAGEHIFEHELVHVREKHSVDKLFLQIVLIVFWCNFFFWLIRRELKMIHEFIADKKSVGQSDAHAFAKMILQAAYPQHYSQLTNQFFNPSIKRRLAMLTKNNNPKLSYFSRILALPLIALLVLAFTVKQKNNTSKNFSAPNKAFTIIDTTAAKQPTAFRAYRDKSIQWVYNDSIGKKISWAAAQKMGFKLDEQVFKAVISKAEKGYIESDLKIATPKLSLDTLIDENPLVVVDGKEIGKKNSINLNQVISVDKVESINILKGEAAIAKYGEKAKDGVIEIKTKKVANPETLLDKIFTKEPKPLIIIDGKESDKLDNVQPDDIESISVLKDATATELYGSKASGGAILITTKGTSGGLKVKAKTADGSEITADEITVDGVKITSVENNSSVTDKNTPTEVRVRGYGQRPIFEKVEQEAEFPGGASAWRRYLERNLNAQVPSDKGAPVGQYTVELQFIVHLDGSLSNIKALTKHGYGMEEEALRAIKKGPKWVPAQQDGQAVVSYRKQAITFVIADQ